MEARFQGEGVVPVEYFLVSTKLDTFCYLTVTAVASTALAMRALRSAVKRGWERRDSVEVGNGGGNGMVGEKELGTGTASTAKDSPSK